MVFGEAWLEGCPEMSATPRNRDAAEEPCDSAPEELERLIQRAEAAGASDIHLQMNARRAEVAFRLDGVMTPALELPEGLAERVFGRIKFLARLKTYQETYPQDGRIDRDAVGAGSDVRVATYPTVTGEKIVLRLFSATPAMRLDELGFPDGARRALVRFLWQQAGLLLLTGPAGSGKTTTIYACLRHLAEQGGRHIITVEDPVEQILPGIMQTEVNEPVGLTYAKATRHLMRQDPQVLVLGEVRDDETANIAVRAAFTGHLVISTLHAGSCRSVFDRLFVLCDDRYAALSAVELVINQRLIRRTCGGCGGAGCEGCLGTGYHGRVPLVEWLRLDETSRAKIRSEGTAVAQPETPLAVAARALVEQGVTDEREYLRMFGA